MIDSYLTADIDVVMVGGGQAAWLPGWASGRHG
jgi:hypothetical protein